MSNINTASDINAIVPDLQQIYSTAARLVELIDSTGELLNQIVAAFNGHTHRWMGSNTTGAAAGRNDVVTRYERYSIDFTTKISTAISEGELLELFRQFARNLSKLNSEFHDDIKRVWNNFPVHFQVHIHQFAGSNTGRTQTNFSFDVFEVLPVIPRYEGFRVRTLDEVRAGIKELRDILNEFERQVVFTKYCLENSRQTFNGHVHRWFLSNTANPTPQIPV